MHAGRFLGGCSSGFQAEISLSGSHRDLAVLLHQARAAGCLSSQELADSDSSWIWACAVSAMACDVQPPQCIQFPSPHAFGVLLYQARASGLHPPQCIQCIQRATPHACARNTQDCGSHGYRTPHDCGPSCTQGGFKEDVLQASQQRSHFKAALGILRVLLYQARAAGCLSS